MASEVSGETNFLMMLANGLDPVSSLDIDVQVR